MTGRENAASKGRRYLVEGRVHLRRVDGDTVSAVVRGDTAAFYTVTHSRPWGWQCTCPAKTRCSHLVAVHLVTVREGATS